MTAVFGCNDTVLVVRNTSATGIHVPAFPPRVGSFIAGAPGEPTASSVQADGALRASTPPPTAYLLHFACLQKPCKRRQSDPP